VARFAKMYERSPQKSPQLTILNRRSLVLTDNPDARAPVAKSVCRALKWLAAILENARDNQK